MLSAFALGLTMAVGAFLWLAVELDTLANVADHVTQAKPLMSMLRFGLIAIVAITWPVLATISRRGSDANGEKEPLLSLRWRVVGWLIIVELVIGQDLIGRSAMALSSLT